MICIRCSQHLVVLCLKLDWFRTNRLTCLALYWKSGVWKYFCGYLWISRISEEKDGNLFCFMRPVPFSLMLSLWYDLRQPSGLKIYFYLYIFIFFHSPVQGNSFILAVILLIEDTKLYKKTWLHSGWMRGELFLPAGGLVPAAIISHKISLNEKNIFSCTFPAGGSKEHDLQTIPSWISHFLKPRPCRFSPTLVLLLFPFLCVVNPVLR